MFNLIVHLCAPQYTKKCIFENYNQIPRNMYQKHFEALCWKTWKNNDLFKKRHPTFDKYFWAAFVKRLTSLHTWLIFSEPLFLSPFGWHHFLFLVPYWSSVSHGSCFYFFQNFHIFTNIFLQRFYLTRSNPNKLFVYLKDDWMFSQHWATCWWHRPSVG